VRIEEMIGLRIRAQREQLTLTQERLGELLGERLGRAWSRQAVSAAEKGERAFTAAELLAFTLALRMTFGALMVPPAGVEYIELPNGATVSRADLIESILPAAGTERTFIRMQETINRLAKTLGHVKEFSDLSISDVQILNEGLLIAQGVDGLLQQGLPPENVILEGGGQL